jgi:hypothetical protein
MPALLASATTTHTHTHTHTHIHSASAGADLGLAASNVDDGIRGGEKGGGRGMGAERAGAGAGGGEKEHEIRMRGKSEIRKRRRGFLSGYEVYVTCEPCVMCSAALGMLGVHRVVMGCSNGAQILKSQYIVAL